MLLLKQSTAATETIGPILDSTGAEYTGAVIGDLSISKNGTEVAMAAAATLTHISNGHYTLVMTTGNTDTLGRLTIRCNKSTYQMPMVEREVLTATAFDTLVTNGTIASTTSGRTIVTDASGLVDANTVKLGPTGSGTAQTARDIGASVLLSNGTGTGQLKLASGYVAMTWADIAAPTTTVNLSGTTIATTQKVDVDTIKTQTLTAAAGITFGVYVGGTAAAAVASTALSTAQWTSARAGYLDNINNSALATTVAQTGDSYAIVSNSTYGNSALKSFFFQAIVSYGGHR